ncbi:unnamed protein product [Auanema sp. JU1783]|nr:unnamed protein product [Auanema sp. JU1783]
MRMLQLDSRFASYRLNKVGIENNVLYLQPTCRKALLICCIDTLFPSSWKYIIHLPVVELIYSKPACSYYTDYIYVLTVLVLEGEETPSVVLFQAHKKTNDLQKFYLDESSGAAFEEVPLEAVKLFCGQEKLHLYDGSIVIGAIPYWDVILDHTTNKFVIERKDIPNDSCKRTTRYPIPVAPESRIFAHWSEEGTLTVSNNEKWEEYVPDPSCSVNLFLFGSRAIHETYGRAGHRVGAIESPMTFYADFHTIIAKVTDHRRHNYFQLCLDHEQKMFKVLHRGVVKYSSGVDRMFYAMVTEKIIALIGIRSIAITPLCPLPLADLCIWEIQKKHTTVDGLGGRKGGLKPDEIWKKCCEVKNPLSLAQSEKID